MKNRIFAWLLAAVLLCPMILPASVDKSAAQNQPAVPALKDVFKDYFLIEGAYNRNLVTGRDPNAAEIAIKHNNTATS